VYTRSGYEARARGWTVPMINLLTGEPILPAARTANHTANQYLARMLRRCMRSVAIRRAPGVERVRRRLSTCRHGPSHWACVPRGRRQKHGRCRILLEIPCRRGLSIYACITAAIRMARLRAENSIGYGAGWTQILQPILTRVARTRATS
jgi:hypothetical protein